MFTRSLSHLPAFFPATPPSVALGALLLSRRRFLAKRPPVAVALPSTLNRAYTKTTFWRAPSKHRGELAWFPSRGTFWHSWSLNQRRSSSRNYALRGKRATEAHGDAPDFPTWHQSSMRLKLRLPFPLGRARRCACTTKFFECVYFFFRGVSKPCNDSNVLVTSLIKRQAWNVWRGTQTKSRHYCSLFFVENYPLPIQTRCNVGSCAE